MGTIKLLPLLLKQLNSQLSGSLLISSSYLMTLEIGREVFRGIFLFDFLMFFRFINYRITFYVNTDVMSKDSLEVPIVPVEIKNDCDGCKISIVHSAVIAWVLDGSVDWSTPKPDCPVTPPYPSDCLFESLLPSYFIIQIRES